LAGADFIFCCKHCNYSWVASWIALLSSHRLISFRLHWKKWHSRANPWLAVNSNNHLDILTNAVTQSIISSQYISSYTSLYFWPRFFNGIPEGENMVEDTRTYTICSVLIYIPWVECV
jgi:hypothetical protein